MTNMKFTRIIDNKIYLVDGAISITVNKFKDTKDNYKVKTNVFIDYDILENNKRVAQFGTRLVNGELNEKLITLIGGWIRFQGV